MSSFRRAHVMWSVRIALCLPSLAYAAAASPWLQQSAVRFIENQGQWPTTARFAAFMEGQTAGEVVRAEPGAIVLQRWGTDSAGQALGAMIRLGFQGSDIGAAIRGADRLPGEHHFLSGDDRARWMVHVPGYSTVYYENLYEDVDLRLEWSGVEPRFALFMQPGACFDDVTLDYGGALSLDLGSDGEVVIGTAVGTLRQRVHRAWEEDSAGDRRLLGCRVLITDEGRVAIDVPDWRRQSRLVIEAGLEWASYLGGGDGEGFSASTCVRIGPDSKVTLAGVTKSPDFPTTPGAFDVSYASNLLANGFVTQFDEHGTELVFSTFFGQAGPHDLQLQANGDITIVGGAGLEFPTTPGAFDRTYNSQGDGFVATLASDGSDLVFSTFIGGSGTDLVLASALDADGSLVVAGATQSFDFPVTPNAFDSSHEQTGGGYDGFVARLSATGSVLEFATYLGGMESDQVTDLALLHDGQIALGGLTKSLDFPFTAGAFQSSWDDMFVAVLSADGAQLRAATALGGSHIDEQLRALAVSPSGDIVVGGFTLSNNFPVTPGAFQTSFTGFLGYDGFVSIFDPGLKTLKHSTYLGAGKSVRIFSLLVDPVGAPIVYGLTHGGFFPTTEGAFKETLPFGDTEDTFVTRFSPDLHQLWYSTFFGGSISEQEGPFDEALDYDSDGSVVITFSTASTDVPTSDDAFQPAFAGATDIVVAKLSLLPAGVAKFGTSTHGSAGFLAAGVTAMPKLGGRDFAVTCTHAPPSSTGWLAVGLGALDASLPLGGAALWLDPAMLLGVLPVRSSDIGACITPLRLPHNPAAIGLQAYVQFFWKDPGAIAGPLSASNALSIVIQP